MFKNKGKVLLLSICLASVLLLIGIYAVSIRIIFAQQAALDINYLRQLTGITLIIIAMLMVVFCVLIFYLLIFNRKSLKASEKEFDDILSGLATAFDDLIIVDSDTGDIKPIKVSPHIEKNYRNIFQNKFNYDLCFKLYAEKDVIEADKHYIEDVSTLEKAKILLKDKNEYSFAYRVLRNNEIHTYNCLFIKPSPDSRKFIQAYKNIDEMVWNSNDREEMQNILEALSSGRWDMDFSDGKISKFTFSTPFLKMLGYFKESEVPKSIEELKPYISEEDIRYLETSFESVLNDKTGKKKIDVTFKIKTKKQGIKWFRTVGRLSRKNDGSPKHFIGLILDVDANTRLFYNIAALAKVYLTIHTIDLETNTCTETKTTKEVAKFVNKPVNADQQMKNVMNFVVADEYKEKVLEFTDFSTLVDRMDGKQIISCEFVSKINGWIRASFVAATYDKDGRPKTVLFTTRIIEDEKQKERDLIDSAHKDELTGLYNRRAYEEAIETLTKKGIAKDFIYLSFDVNGLKVANDNLGHSSGDELLKGAATVMEDVFGKYGKLYRTGGDEFVAMMNLPEKKFQEQVNIFNTKISKWKGKSIKKLSISLGYASAAKLKHATITQLSKFSDQRMYDNKASYYTNLGIDRRSDRKYYDKLFD